MRQYVITSLAAIVFATSCMGHAKNTQKGASLAAALGSGLGAIIGNQSGEPAKGALLGGAAGMFF